MHSGSKAPSVIKKSAKAKKAEEAKDPFALIKQGVWLYFILLIFEGALRKWVLPGLAAPLLIVRDPLAVALIVLCWQRGIKFSNGYVVAMSLIGLVGTFTAIFLGHGSLAVAVYGARILMIHFPFIFIIGSVLSREDVVKIGRAIIYLSIPMAILIALQFYSPQSAWVNRGVGGDMEGAGFSGAMGYFRPPGTFSFTNGTTLFFSLTACFLFYFWLNVKEINRIVLITATFGLVTAIPFSISRGLTFSIAVAAIFLLMALSRKPSYFGKVMVTGIGLVIALSILSEAAFFNTATEVFFTRFERAAESEGGLEGTLIDRYLGGLVGALAESANQPFFGYGIGVGTNVGSVLLRGGRFFLISEGEWGRLIGELGPLLGIGVIFIRLHLSFKLALAGFARLKTGDILPWLVLSNALLVLPQGQWAQPTTLGFSTLAVGLLVASFNNTNASSESSN